MVIVESTREVSPSTIRFPCTNTFVPSKVSVPDSALTLVPTISIPPTLADVVTSRASVVITVLLCTEENRVLLNTSLIAKTRLDLFVVSKSELRPVRAKSSTFDAISLATISTLSIALRSAIMLTPGIIIEPSSRTPKFARVIVLAPIDELIPRKIVPSLR